MARKPATRPLSSLRPGDIVATPAGPVTVAAVAFMRTDKHNDPVAELPVTMPAGNAAYLSFDSLTSAVSIRQPA
jgi:hypothetical protein